MATPETQGAYQPTRAEIKQHGYPMPLEKMPDQWFDPVTIEQHTVDSPVTTTIPTEEVLATERHIDGVRAAGSRGTEEGRRDIHSRTFAEREDGFRGRLRKTKLPNGVKRLILANPEEFADTV